jgi:hypothetical protein
MATKHSIVNLWGEDCGVPNSTDGFDGCGEEETRWRGRDL